MSHSIQCSHVISMIKSCDALSAGGSRLETTRRVSQTDICYYGWGLPLCIRWQGKVPSCTLQVLACFFLNWSIFSFQLAGITERPDFKCHLDSAGEYAYHNLHDYPSAAAIADVLNDNGIIPIFAVTNNVREVYDQLREVIRSASVTTRTANSENLLNTVVEQYQVRQHFLSG